MNKDQIIELAAKVAVEAVREYDQKQIKSRHDKRLRNTKLLLENYILLHDHCQNAVYDKQQIINSEMIDSASALDILDSIDKYDKDAYIESIKKSTIRTRIILAHVDAMLELYHVYCERSKKKEDIRRYRVLTATYFEEQTPEEIAEAENIDERTYYRDMRDAREKVSALIFGIDGLHNVS